jgi:hypothetical protein
MSKPLTEISSQEFDNRIGSLVGGLFIFYLLLSGNFTGELLNCQFQNILRNNIIIKHVVGFFMLYFFVNLASTNVNWNAGIKFGLTIVLFLFFILSNRSEGYIVLTNIGLLALIYILQLVRDTNQTVIDDATSSEDDKKDATESLNRIRNVQIVTISFIFIFIVFGFILYVGRRKLEYGYEFKFSKLLFSSECANDVRINYSYKDMLKAAFTPITSKSPKSPTKEIIQSVLVSTKLSPAALTQKTNELATLLNSPLIRKQLEELQKYKYQQAVVNVVNKDDGIVLQTKTGSLRPGTFRRADADKTFGRSWAVGGTESATLGLLEETDT